MGIRTLFQLGLGTPLRRSYGRLSLFSIVRGVWAFQSMILGNRPLFFRASSCVVFDDEVLSLMVVNWSQNIVSAAAEGLLNAKS